MAEILNGANAESTFWAVGRVGKTSYYLGKALVAPSKDYRHMIGNQGIGSDIESGCGWSYTTQRKVKNIVLVSFSCDRWMR